MTDAALLPGERRMSDGTIYTFDMDARRQAIARQDVEAAPDDLTTLSDDDLRGLRYAAISVDWQRRGCAACDALGAAVTAELKTRGLQ
jgi:hypothetical protein